VAAGYSATPLPKKLGIKPGSTVALVDAPDGFERELPEAAVRRGARGRFELAIWFVRAARDLRPERMASLARNGPLWIAWPKRASGWETDLTENVVRVAGLAHGLVDYKVCAIDDTWSGLLFARRR
jgi:hypothetical protein